MFKINEKINLSGTILIKRIITNNLVFMKLKTNEGEIQIYFSNELLSEDKIEEAIEIQEQDKIILFGIVKLKNHNKYEYEIGVIDFKKEK
jgi:aspartate--tRNA ligase